MLALIVRMFDSKRQLVKHDHLSKTNSQEFFFRISKTRTDFCFPVSVRRDPVVVLIDKRNQEFYVFTLCIKTIITKVPTV